MSMRAAILARVSDAKQLAVGGDGGRHTLAGQFETLERMAAREGWSVVRVFEIPGETAYSSEYAARPLFAAAVEAAERREFDILLVAEFSRFARNLRVGFDALYRLRRAGVRLIDERGIDYTADEDRAVMEAWSASKASRDHAGRVRRGIEAQFRRGLPVGDIPFGYRRVFVADGRGGLVADTSVPPVVVPEEAEAIRWGYEEFARRGSAVGVAEEFNRRGLAPRSKRGNVRFEASSVDRILTSRFYVGFVSHGGEELPGLHVPIVSEEAWAAVQARRGRGTRQPRSTRLLSGRVVCVYCDQRLEVHRAGSGTVTYRKRRSLGRPCWAEGSRGMRAEPMEAEVSRVVEALALDGDWLAYVDAQARAGVRTVTSPRRGEIREELRRLGVAYRAGAIDDREFATESRRLNGELAGMRDFEAVGVAASQVRSVADAWAVFDAETRREVVGELFEAIVADPWLGEWWFAPREEYVGLMELRRGWVATGPPPGKGGGPVGGLVRPGGPERHKPPYPRSLYRAHELTGAAG